MSKVTPRTCSEDYPHEAHFYVSFVAGGEPGPVPTASHICPGRTHHLTEPDSTEPRRNQS